MSTEGIAAFVGFHSQEVRPLYPWLAVAHVTDDCDPAVIAGVTGNTTGAVANGPCSAGSPTPGCTPDGRFHYQLTPDMVPGIDLVWHEAGHQVDRTLIDREGPEDKVALYTEWAELIGRPELVRDGRIPEFFASGLTKAMTGREGGYITFGTAYPVQQARSWYLGLEKWSNTMMRTYISPDFGLATDAQGYAETTLLLPDFDPTRETVVDVYRVGLAQGERYQGHPVGQAGFVPVSGQTRYGVRVRVTNDSVKGGTAYLKIRAQQAQ